MFILGDLKLMKFHEDGRTALFDLSKDLGERNDLAAQRADQAADLERRLDQRLAALKAQFPTPNPDFSPDRPVRPIRKRNERRPDESGRKGTDQERARQS